MYICHQVGQYLLSYALVRNAVVDDQLSDELFSIYLLQLLDCCQKLLLGADALVFSGDPAVLYLGVLLVEEHDLLDVWL